MGPSRRRPSRGSGSASGSRRRGRSTGSPAPLSPSCPSAGQAGRASSAARTRSRLGSPGRPWCSPRTFASGRCSRSGRRRGRPPLRTSGGSPAPVRHHGVRSPCPPAARAPSRPSAARSTPRRRLPRLTGAAPRGVAAVGPWPDCRSDAGDRRRRWRRGRAPTPLVGCRPLAELVASLASAQAAILRYARAAAGNVQVPSRISGRGRYRRTA